VRRGQAAIEGLQTTRLRPPEQREIEMPTLSFEVTQGVRGKLKIFE